MTALALWQKAMHDHIVAYGRPPVLFSSNGEEPDDYHRELFKKWLAAVDMTGAMVGVGTLTAKLTPLLDELAQAARELRLAMIEADYFAQFSGEDEDEVS